MTIKDELLALKNDDGLLIVEDVWDWAKSNPGSSLHNSITWDVQKAAREHQFWQIRRLIAIHVVTEESDRKLVSLSIDRVREGGGYRDINDVVPVPELRKILLDDALRELERLEQKYKRVTELVDVWEAAHKARTRTRQTKRSPAPHISAHPQQNSASSA